MVLLWTSTQAFVTQIHNRFKFLRLTDLESSLSVFILIFAACVRVWEVRNCVSPHFSSLLWIHFREVSLFKTFKKFHPLIQWILYINRINCMYVYNVCEDYYWSIKGDDDSEYCMILKIHFLYNFFVWILENCINCKKIKDIDPYLSKISFDNQFLSMLLAVIIKVGLCYIPINKHPMLLALWSLHSWDTVQSFIILSFHFFPLVEFQNHDDDCCVCEMVLVELCIGQDLNHLSSYIDILVLDLAFSY